NRPMSPPPSKPANPPPSMATVAESMPSRPADRPDYATVVAQPPIIADQKPAVPQAERPRPEPVQPMASPPPGTTAFPKCGLANGPGNSFCANCGSALTVARTIVMASPQAVPKARLHLVMEGGQQGDVFDLSD